MEVDYLIMGFINAMVLPLIVIAYLTTSMLFIPWGSVVGATIMGLLLLLDVYFKEYEKAISTGLLISALISIIAIAYIIVEFVFTHADYFFGFPA